MGAETATRVRVGVDVGRLVQRGVGPDDLTHDLAGLLAACRRLRWHLPADRRPGTLLPTGEVVGNGLPHHLPRLVGSSGGPDGQRLDDG